MKKTSAVLDVNSERSADAIGEAVSQKLLADARQIIDTARANAVRSVDFNRVMMYWNLGRRVFEEEQHGKDRAEYGARIIRGLAERLEPEYGSGFGIRQLEQSRRFYRLYPIAHTLYAQLNWSQYKLLISIEDAQEREYYQLEAVNHCWTKRELERQIHSQLWERLCLSNDKEAILVKVEGLGTIGHVANSVHTVLGESCSAGRIYDRFKKKAKGKVVVVTPKGALCELRLEK